MSRRVRVCSRVWQGGVVTDGWEINEKDYWIKTTASEHMSWRGRSGVFEGEDGSN